MFYSQDVALWGFIAHIPLAIAFLIFLSRAVAIREQGGSLVKLLFDDRSRQILSRFAVAGIFGLVVIGTLSPISRMMLQ